MTSRAEFEDARRALSFAHERQSSLCAPFLDVLPVTGAAVSVLSGSLGQATLCASNTVAARLDEIQFDLGEGPCWQAMNTRLPVLEPDLRLGDHSNWPVFAETVLSDETSKGVAAMFAFPLTVGSLELGAVDLYTVEPSQLTRAQVTDAAELADVAAWQVLRRVLDEHDTEGDLTGASRREVHQATGMVLAQLQVSAEDAGLLLRAHAYAQGKSVREIANDVVERRLNFATPGVDGEQS